MCAAMTENKHGSCDFTDERISNMLNSSNTPSANRDGMALLVIDVQTALFERSTPIYKADDLLRNIMTLIQRAREAGTPVFYVQHANEKLLPEGSEGWQLHPQLQAVPPDALIHKCHGSAFQETQLKEFLDVRNVGTLVITGLVTHGCVKATGQDALKQGYTVILTEDAHSSYSKDAARLIEEWNGKLGEAGATVLPTEEVDFSLCVTNRIY
jgi:nicotinamidase-related amidase